jgi:5-methylcytosine-specific restriction endonuclease McrA
VHHLAGKGAGDDPANLVAACQHCNLKVGDPTKHDPDPIPWTGW